MNENEKVEISRNKEKGVLITLSQVFRFQIDLLSQ
jgi:hypothetical protein